MTDTNISRGRCYCGATAFSFAGKPLSVAMCHCDDCKRWTGAPAPAFAAFPADALQSDIGAGREANENVHRWNCTTCGSPIAATFAYIPNQIYVPVGVLEDAADMPPTLYCFANQAYPWVHLDDHVPRAADSGRDALIASADLERTKIWAIK